LVHSDINCPLETPSLSSVLYFIIFIDDYSRKTYIYFLKHKSEAFVIFQEFKALVEKESRKCIKTLCTDNAREYTKTKISSYLSKHGIKHQRIVPDKWFQVCLNPSVVNLIEASILSKIMTLA